MKSRILIFSRFAALILLTAALQSCFLNPIIGHGYEVRIKVQDPKFKIESAKYLEEIAIQENFAKWKFVEEGQWFALYYYRNFSDEEIKKMDGKYIGVTISHDGKDGFLHVTIENIVDGQSKLLKDEIDRIASLFIETLTGTYGKDDLTIVRARTGLGL